jgi:methionyl-tRNA formyltransferase
LKHAPKIFTETCEINWNNNAESILNLIRGLSPYPAAFTFLAGKRLKIFSAKIEHSGNGNNQIGVPETDGKHYLRFSCADGYVYPLELQMEGKRKMLIDEFLRGFKMP